jgi:hypothetical protein
MRQSEQAHAPQPLGGREGGGREVGRGRQLDMSDSTLKVSRGAQSYDRARQGQGPLSLNVSRASDTDSLDESINPDPEVQVEEAAKQLRSFLQGAGLERHTDQLINTFSIQAPNDISRISNNALP